ncbi:MAG: hypothetical protein PHQ34_12170 [Methanothrix sp.]|nr:hypothetical protein [Methanothrix sp.]
MAGMTVLGFLIGLILNSLDQYIYRFFEGIQFWPDSIWWRQYRRELKNYEVLDSKLKSDEDELKLKIEKLNSDLDAKEKAKIEEEIKKLNINLLNYSRKIRNYPYDPEEKFRTKRRPAECTNLGNVIAEYENYPKEQYGMDFNVFWYHLWQTMPKEVRDEIDISSAKADFLVYFSFIFLLTAPFSILKAFFERDAIYTYIQSSVHFNHYYLCLFIEFILQAACFLLISYLFYKISVVAHKNYGRYIKSAFDIYRIGLSTKTGILIPLCPNKVERGVWIEYGKFLEDYKELQQYEFRKRIK